MPRVATQLSPTKSGGWFARKCIPEDVQDAYEKLYGVRWEERLTLEPMASASARARLRDWQNEIEARIAGPKKALRQVKEATTRRRPRVGVEPNARVRSYGMGCSLRPFRAATK